MLLHIEMIFRENLCQRYVCVTNVRSCKVHLREKLYIAIISNALLYQTISFVDELFCLRLSSA